MYLPLALIFLAGIHLSQGIDPPAASDKGCVAAKVQVTEFTTVAPSYDPKNLKRQECRTLCKSANFKYAGLRNGDMCLCGDSYGAAGTATGTCTLPCTGEASATCGGISSYHVYATPSCDPGMSVQFFPTGHLATYEKANVTAVMTSCNPTSIALSYTDGTPDRTSTALGVDFYPQDIGDHNVMITATDNEGYTQSNYTAYKSYMRVETELDCPDYWSELHVFECTAIFPMGNDMQATIDYGNGDSTTFTPSDAQIYKYGTLQGTPSTGTSNHLYLLVNNVAQENGTIMGVDYSTTLTTGTFKVQVYRPQCDVATPFYCHRTRTCTATSTACASQQPIGISCGASALYSLTKRVCVSKTTGQVVPHTVATAWSGMPTQKFLLVAEDTVTVTAAGEYYAPLDSRMKVMQGDIFGILDVNGVVSTTSSVSGWQFSLTPSSTPVVNTFVVTTANPLATQLLARIHVVSPSLFKVQYTYTTGLNIYNISLSASNSLPSSSGTHRLIDIQQNITNLELVCPSAVKTNSTASMSIPTHPGNKVWYTWNFDDGNETLDQAQTMDHTFTNAGVYTVNLTAANNISEDSTNCTVIVQDEIQDLVLTPGQIATYFTQHSLMGWNISQGTNVTYSLNMDNNENVAVSHTQTLATAGHYTCMHEGLRGNLSYKYSANGNYSVCLNASNLVSTQTVCKYFSVQVGIKNVNIDSVKVLTWGIENSVPVSMSQGSDYTCYANFGTDRLSDNMLSLPENTHAGYAKIAGSYAVGYHALLIHCQNLVSQDNDTKLLLIEYVLTDCKIVASAYHVPVPSPVKFNVTMLRGSHYLLSVDSDNSGGTHTRDVQKTEASDVEQITLDYNTVKVSNVLLLAQNNISTCNQTAKIVAQNPVKNIIFDMPGSIVLNKGATASVIFGLTLPLSTLPPTNASYQYSFGDSNSKTGPFVVQPGGKMETTHTYSDISTLNITVNISNLVSFMFFERTLRVDQPITDLAITANRYAVPFGNEIIATTTMSWGSRITVVYDFGDGSPTRTSYYESFQNQMAETYTYTAVGFYYIKITATNSVGQRIATSEVIFVQNIVRGLTIHCPAKTHLLKAGNWQVGYTFSISLAAGTPMPTNTSSFAKFGDGVNLTQALILTGNPSSGNISHPKDYRKGDKYFLSVNVSNLVSWVMLNCTHDVIEEIEGPVLALTHNHSGMPVGPISMGGKLYLPSDEDITLTLTMSHGSHQTMDIDFGDTTTSTTFNKTTLTHTFAFSTVTITGSIKNEIIANNPIPLNSFTITFIRACWDIGLYVDNPRPINTSFDFQVDAGRVCTDGCYFLDLQDDAALVGKRYRLFGNEAECKRHLPQYMSGGQYFADSQFEPLDEAKLLADKPNTPDNRANFTLKSVYMTVGRYNLVLRAMNFISDEKFPFGMKVTNGWCYPPVLNFELVACGSCDSNGHPQVMKSQPFQVTIRPVFNCTGPGILYWWDVVHIDQKTNEEIPVSKKCLPQLVGNSTSSLYIPARCLGYGLYKFSVNVSMISEVGIYTVGSQYRRIIKTPLQTLSGENAYKYNANVSLDVLTKVIDLDDPYTKQGFTCEWLCKRSCETWGVYNYDEPGFTREVSPSKTRCPMRPYTVEEQEAKDKNLPVDDQWGCFAYDEAGPGFLNISHCSNVTLDTYNLPRNHTLDLKVIIRKDTRFAIVDLMWRVVEGDPPETIVRCVGDNCHPSSLDSTNKASHASDIPNFKRGMVFRFIWILAAVHENGTTEELADSRWVGSTTTGNKLDNLVINPNFFGPDDYDKVYMLRVKVWQLPIIDENNYGSASRRFKINRPPLNGACAVLPNYGVAASTPFHIRLLKDFVDDDFPIKYSLTYKCGDDKKTTPLFSGLSTTKSGGSVLIPQVQSDENVTCTVFVRAMDGIGSFTDISCDVLVGPPPQEELAKMAAPSPQQFADMQASGDPSAVVQFAMAFAKVSSTSDTSGTVSSGTGSSDTGSSGSSGSDSSGSSGSTSEQTEAEKEQARQEQTQLVDQFVGVMASIEVRDISTATNVLQAATAVTSNPQMVSDAATDSCLDLLLTVSATLSNDETATETQTKESTAAMMNVMSNALLSMNTRAAQAGIVTTSTAPTGSSSTTAARSENVQQTAQQLKTQTARLEKIVDAVTDVLSKKMVTGDNPQTVGSNDSYLITVAKVFKKQFSTAGYKVVGIAVPQLEDMLAGEESESEGNSSNIPYAIECKISSASSNPYPWDDSSLITNTQVTSLKIIDERGEKVNVSKSQEWIEVTLLHLRSKINETVVNVTAEQEEPPILSFQVLNASALFMRFQVFDMPKNDNATQTNKTQTKVRRKRAASDNTTTDATATTASITDAPHVTETTPAANSKTTAAPNNAPVAASKTGNSTNSTDKDTATWCLKNPELTFKIYLKSGEDDPTPEEYDFECTVPLTDEEVEAFIKKYRKEPKWNKATFDRCTCFIPNSRMNLTKPTPFRMLVAPTNMTSNETITNGLQYGVKVWTPSCQYYDPDASVYKTEGVEVGPLSNENQTQCLTEHLTSFGGGFVVPMNTINLKESAFTKLNENPVVFATMVSIMCLYLVMLIYVRKKDKTDEIHAGATPLLDNVPEDKYLYELVFFTGSRKNAGTSAKVHVIISGENGETEPRLIWDDKRAVLKRSGVDVFLMAVPRPLGPLTYLRIWHDNAGDYPSWYFERMQVTDLQTEDVYFFVCDRWLAVEEDDGMIDRVMPVAGMEELTHFNHLFWIKAKRDLTDGHIWFSVFQRPKRSRFTRVQRLTCCLTLLFSSMMASILFYKADENIEGKQVLRLGPIELTPQQIYVGFISSLIAFPANIILALMFRYSAEFPKKKKDEQPIKHGSNVLVVDNHEHKKIKRPEDEHRKMENELMKQSEYLDTGDLDQRLLSSPNRPGTASTSTSSDSYDNDITALALPQPPAKKKKFELHWCFKIIAYILSLCIVTVTFWVTVEVAGVFGKKKSMQWLLAYAISVVESIFLSQPIKVLVLAAFYALVIKKPDTDSDNVGTTDLRKNEEWLHKHFTEEDMKNPETMKLVASYKSSLPEPPDEEYLQEARQLRFKEIKMNKIIWEIIFYFLFLWLLMMVAYGNRDDRAFLVYQHYQRMLVKGSYDKISAAGDWNLEELRSREEFWRYVDQVLIPGLFDNTWYDGKQHSSTEGFLADKAGFLVGQPRLRQVRTVSEECHGKVKHIDNSCEKAYSIFSQDEGEYSYGWKKVNYSDPAYSKPAASWLYRTWIDLSGYPFWGKYNTYSGGGFTAELGKDIATAKKKYEELRSNRWIDGHTRAIFIEFLVYNPSVNLFGISMVAMEVQESGAMYLYFKFHVMRLDRYVGAFMFVVLTAEILTLIFIIYFMVKEFKKFRKLGKAYFKDSWNIYEVLILCLAIVTIVMYFFRLVHSARLGKRLREEPYKFHNLQYAALWDQVFTFLMAFLCSLSTLKFLKLLRFNKRMAMLSSTLRYAAGPIIQFLVMFMILFLAFVLASYIIFGMDLEDFSTFARSMATLFSAMLNKFNFYNLKEADRIFGPTILFLFTLMVTFILINVFITLICEAFSVIKDDISQQSNEYEIVDFVVDRFKMATGLGDPKTKMPVRRRKVKQYSHSDYVEGRDEDASREHEHIDVMMSKLEFLIFHKDHKSGKPVNDPSDNFNDWRVRKKKGFLYK